MVNRKSVAVFSDSQDSMTVFQSLQSSGNYTVLFRKKDKNGINTVMGQKLDAIVIEISSPVMTEIDFVDQIAEILFGIPIIVVSSYFYDTKDIVFGDKLYDFIHKPLHYNRLNESLKNSPAPVPKELKKKMTVIETVEDVNKVLKENKKLSVLLEISKAINSKTDFEELLHQIIVLTADAVNAERATLFIVDKKNKELWSRTGIGIEKTEIRFPITQGIAGEVATTGATLIIDDPYNHPKFNKEFDQKSGFVTKNILCLPLKNLNGEIIGVFQILNKKEGNFTQEDSMFLTAMAVNTGIALENSMLHHELKIKLEEIKQSYDDLYIAQNQILKEARFTTMHEMTVLLKNLFMKDVTIQRIVEELTAKFPNDPLIKKVTTVLNKRDEVLAKIFEDAIEKKKNEIFHK